MVSLFSRRGAPFILSGANPGKILDLRIHWTEDDVTPDTFADLAPGESVLAGVVENVGSDTVTLTFHGRHPLLQDTYFSTDVTIDTTMPAAYIPYITESGVYQVQSGVGSYVVYMVVDASGSSEQLDISMCVQNPRIVLLVNLTSSTTGWVTETTDTGVVEPFNVIFDYLPKSVEQIVPVFVDQSANSVTIADNYFTNTPVKLIGATTVNLPTAHRFSINGDTLSFIDLPVSAEPDQKILSINGVTADHGGITIKILP